MQLFRFKTFAAAAVLAAAALPYLAHTMELMVDTAAVSCSDVSASALVSASTPAPAATPPRASARRLDGSQIAQGQRDISWAWLGTPTARYPHTALGSRFHAGSLHVLLAPTAGSTGPLREVIYELPLNRVFEDLLVRLVDINQDGRDEIVLVEADALRGASVVVLGLTGSGDARKLVELARSPPAGSTFRWLNPVGVADFDGDGKLDVAAVVTPHIGGELTLYHYAPPRLVPFAKAMDTSNHLMGAPQQQLATIVEVPGLRPTIIVPSMTLKALHALRWEGNALEGKFKELADVMPLPARIERITALAAPQLGACVHLADGSFRRVLLQH